MWRYAGVVVWVVLVCQSGRLCAEQVLLSPIRDNTIFSESQNSGGLATSLFAGRNNNAGLRRGLLQFDVASALPANAMITAAEVTMTMDSAAQTETEPRDIGLHRVLAAWGEGTSGGGGAGGGQGQAPTTGDATWSYRLYDTESWITPGGDFTASASGVASVGVALGPYAWSSTSTLVDDVQAWLDDPASNFGWILIGDESRNGTVRRFYSQQAADIAVRPSLMIDYQIVPEPASVLLLCASLIGLVARRRDGA